MLYLSFDETLKRLSSLIEDSYHLDEQTGSYEATHNTITLTAARDYLLGMAPDIEQVKVSTFEEHTDHKYVNYDDYIILHARLQEALKAVPSTAINKEPSTC